MADPARTEAKSPDVPLRPRIPPDAPWHTDVLLLLMAAIWGINFSVLKYTAGFIGPLAINALRIPGAGVAQLLIARGRRMQPPTPSEVRMLILLGMLGNGVYQVLFILGLVRARVATAALLIAATPAFVAIVGRMMGTERLALRQWAGVAMQLAGCSTVAVGAVGAARGDDTVVGVVLLLSAAFSWSFYAVNVKKYSDHVEPWYLGGYTMIGGAVVVLLVGVPSVARVDWAALPGRVWLSLFYSCLIAMVVAYLFYYRGLKVLGPTRTSMYSNLQPIIALLVAWGLLHERPSATQIVGAGLIVGGLLTTRYASEPAEA
ncbi:MAG: DMT family transporter [Gemmatimonadaceae bacterium]